MLWVGIGKKIDAIAQRHQDFQVLVLQVANFGFGSGSDYRHRHPDSPLSGVKQTELVGKRTLPL